jgi:hypothetical protein
MTFAWEGKTPEGYVSRADLQERRRKAGTLEQLSRLYASTAESALSGPEGNKFRDEAARFATRVLSATEGLEQGEQLDALLNALALRKAEVLETLPDDVHERRAFAFALVRAYKQSIH